MFNRRTSYTLPGRLWRRILEAHDGDEQLASTALAVAFMVAAENVAVGHRPKPRRVIQPARCPHCGSVECRPEPAMVAERPYARDVVPADGIEVREGPTVEMPVMDPWRGSWD